MALPSEHDLAEYQALKRAVRGGVRTAQGRTWRRPVRVVVHRKVLRPLRQHPAIAVEVVVGLAVVGIFIALLPVMHDALTARLPPPMEMGQGLPALDPLVHASLHRIFMPVMVVVMSVTVVLVGIRLMIGR